MEISVAFTPSNDTPSHIAVAEGLGFRRAWCYDSPAYYVDPWVTLARGADRTSTIGLGVGVLVPSLRHLMVTAGAVASLADLSNGRLSVAIGTGFSGRMALGHRAMKWADVEAYVEGLRGLLCGDVVDWEGRKIQMQHPQGFVASRPVSVPIWIAADGPKGFAVANKWGDGAFFAPTPHAKAVEDLPMKSLLAFGTVLDDGESPTSARAVDAYSAQLAAIYHIAYERGGVAAVDSLPGGSEWRRAIESIGPEYRHLAIHEGHLVAPNERDQVIVREGVSVAENLLWIDTADRLRERVEAMEDEGITELVFQPGGSDIVRELEAFSSLMTR
ncbi:LLM class flavin-dependent oxidoreductase [Rhodococcus opacus]|uniref:LLM class flavin-dependent oxidoreductase n=1 Tax=Rhodococcus opacus TaxID=37919 RepID=UPI00294A154B|nr:LLM class flavin-dependent oxidoreductase [Rhodococcus opacus]MDV6247454.1 LLM class flavin-dependent oxidoreductase [Rhodococcus opacus]